MRLVLSDELQCVARPPNTTLLTLLTLRDHQRGESCARGAKADNRDSGAEQFRLPILDRLPLLGRGDPDVVSSGREVAQAGMETDATLASRPADRVLL